MGEATCQDPGIDQNSFPPELIRQRSKKSILERIHGLPVQVGGMSK